MRARERAFTLIELMVTLAITGMMLVVIYGVIVTTLRARERMSEAGELGELGPAILDLLEGDLRALTPYDIADLAVLRGVDHTIGGEDADGIDFICTTDATVPEETISGMTRSDECEVGYRVRNSPHNPDFLELWRREQNHVDGDPFAGGVYQLLTDRLRALDIKYLFEDPSAPPAPRGMRSFEEEREWDTTRRGGFPAGIRVTLSLDLFPGKVREDLPPEEVERYLRTYVRTIPLARDLELCARLVPIPPSVARTGSEGEGGGEGTGGGNGDAGGGGGNSGGGGGA